MQNLYECVLGPAYVRDVFSLNVHSLVHAYIYSTHIYQKQYVQSSTRCKRTESSNVWKGLYVMAKCDFFSPGM